MNIDTLSLPEEDWVVGSQKPPAIVQGTTDILNAEAKPWSSCPLIVRGRQQGAVVGRKIVAVCQALWPHCLMVSYESKCSQWGRSLLGPRTLRWANCSRRAGGLGNPSQWGFLIALEQWLMDALIIPFWKEESSIMAVPLFPPHGALAANTFSVSTSHWIIGSHSRVYHSVLLLTQRSWTLTLTLT